jgi:hypothetical protein
MTIHEPWSCAAGTNRNLELNPNFWKFTPVQGRDWLAEKKLRKMGISPHFMHWLPRSGFDRDLMRAFNKRKKQRRARTGRHR